MVRSNAPCWCWLSSSSCSAMSCFKMRLDIGVDTAVVAQAHKALEAFFIEAHLFRLLPAHPGTFIAVHDADAGGERLPARRGRFGFPRHRDDRCRCRECGFQLRANPRMVRPAGDGFPRDRHRHGHRLHGRSAIQFAVLFSGKGKSACSCIACGRTGPP